MAMPVVAWAWALTVSCLARGASAACTASDTTFCMTVDIFASETGYYNVEGHAGSSPELQVKIGEVYTFDQTDVSNWYHPIGFAFFPDGAHGATWGGEEQDEVEDPYLAYEIDGARPAGDCAPLGLDCYEPEFFYPRADWETKKYTAVLNVTEELAQASYGGVIYYFCHIHSRMSGKIRILNSDGSALDAASLPRPTENSLYGTEAPGAFDALCGTSGAYNYSAEGNLACAMNLLPGTLDTDFEKCLQAIDCKMKTEMRVLGYDSHATEIASFMQQMIPHHINAVNMAKLLLKLAPTAVADVEDLEGILWGIVNTQNYQVHQFRAYLGTHAPYLAATDDMGDMLTAESVGHHCDTSLGAGVDLAIAPTTESTNPTSDVQDCMASDTNICVKVNLLAGESGYYEFAGHTGPSPTISAKLGDTIVFDQRDATNWYHPIGFAYYPDGAHGAEWGGDERAEVEGAGELLYKIDGASTTCPDAGDTGLDCYEPEFFYPRGDWMMKKYSAELTITQDVIDASHGGVIYYFCHIHSRMSGKIVLKNTDGSDLDTASLPNPTELELYETTTRDGVDVACGTTDVANFAGGGSMECDQAFLCGTLDTDFEKCMQAINCKMEKEMASMVTADSPDMVGVFMQQMIPHHLNAVNMAKILLQQVSPGDLDAALDEGELTHILYDIVNVQNYQIHQFRNYLGSNGYYVDPSSGADGNTGATSNPHSVLGPYTPVSNVIEHSQMVFDVEAITNAAGMQDWDTALFVYTEGQNSCKGGDNVRTLQAFVSQETATAKLVGEAFFDSFTNGDGPNAEKGPIPGNGRLTLSQDFWDTFMLGALGGTGSWAGISSAMREMAVKKGVLGVLTMYTTHEMESAIGKAVAGNVADDTGAPHAWDEGWAFYYGSHPTAGKYSAWEFTWKRDLDFCTTDGSGTAFVTGCVVGSETIDDYFLQGLRASRAGTTDTAEMILARDNIYRILALSSIRAALKYAYLTQSDGYDEEYHIEAYTYFLAAAGWVEQASSGAGSQVLGLLDYTKSSAELDPNLYCSVKAALVPSYAGLGLDCVKVGEYYRIPDSFSCANAMPDCPAVTILPDGLSSYAPTTNTIAGSNVECDPAAGDGDGDADEASRSSFAALALGFPVAWLQLAL